MLNWSEPAISVLNCIRAASQAAEGRRYAEAIKMAWAAEAFAAEFARALEDQRVIEAGKVGGL